MPIKKFLTHFLRYVRFMNLKVFTWFAMISYTALHHKNELKSHKNKQVYIFGWYGTETTGDKAILYSIIQSVLKIAPTTKFVISSYNPKYTQNTLIELNIKTDIKIIQWSIKKSIKYIRDSDLVIIGGGPLMEDSAMYGWLKKVIIAKLVGTPVMVYACGVGPIHTKMMESIIALIVKCADIVTVRDNRSKNILKHLGINKNVVVTADPAVLFNNQPSHKQKDENKHIIGICVRTWPKNYFVNYDSTTTYEIVYQNFKRSMAELIKHAINQYNAKIVLIPMHTIQGDDDREAAKEIVNLSGCAENVSFITDSKTPFEVLDWISQTNLFIGMRFHSIIFSAIAGNPMMAIDYDMKIGKVWGMMDKIGQTKYCLNIKEFRTDILISKFDELVSQKEYIRHEINEKMSEVKREALINEKCISELLL